MKFDKRKVLNRIRQIVKSYCEAACNQVQLEWSRYYRDEVEGESQIEPDVQLAQDKVVAILTAYGQRAWIIEYGRGSKMDTSKTNPYLDEYLRSDIINPARQGKAITGRPEGTYQDLDGNIHTSKGFMVGKIIEGTHHKGEYPYRPLKGQHIIDKVLFGGQTEFDVFVLAAGKTAPKRGLVSDMLNEIQTVINDSIRDMLDTFPKQIGMK